MERSKNGLPHAGGERRARGGGQADERATAILSGITKTARAFCLAARFSIASPPFAV